MTERRLISKKHAVMTKNFKSYVLSALAVAAIAFSGCSKNEEGMHEVQKKDFSVVLSGVSTKTTNNGMSTLWAAEDAINIFHSDASLSDPEYVSDGKFTTATAGATATFTGTLKSFDETKNYNWYAFYPYTSQITTPANTSGYVVVGSTYNGTQTQNGNNSTAHISGKNYPIAGMLSEIAGTEQPVFNMQHLSSLVAVKVTNGTSTAITVSNVSLSTEEEGGEYIVGTYYIDFTDIVSPVFVPSQNSDKTQTYASKTAKLKVTGGDPIAAGESATFYLAIKPFSLSAGDELTLSITGSNGVEERTINAPDDYVFAPGKMKHINFTYNKEPGSFTTIAGLNALALAEAGNKVGHLTNAVVSFVPDEKNAIIKDATGSILLYKNGHGLKQGQTYTGDITVAAQAYNNCSEITNISGATFTGEETPVEPETLTLAQLNGNLTTYQNAYVKVENLEVTEVSADGKNLTVKNGTNTYVVYTYFGASGAVVGDIIVSATGTIAHYSGNDQIKVWASSDMTISHTPTTHAINFTQPSAGGTIKVSVGGSEITSGTMVMEGVQVKVQIDLTGTHEFTTWNITGAKNLTSTTSHVVYFDVGTEDVTISASLVPLGSSVVYTLDGTTTGGTNGYATASDITQNGILWKVTGNTTQNPWRIGGKNLSGVDRTVYSTTAMSNSIIKIEITHGAASGVTVNSMTVIVSKNADFSSPISTLTPTFVANNKVTIEKPSGQDWTNCYYKIIYNITVTSTSENKFIQFVKAEFTGM